MQNVATKAAVLAAIGLLVVLAGKAFDQLRARAL